MQMRKNATRISPRFSSRATRRSNNESEGSVFDGISKKLFQPVAVLYDQSAVTAGDHPLFFKFTQFLVYGFARYAKHQTKFLLRQRKCYADAFGIGSAMTFGQPQNAFDQTCGQIKEIGIFKKIADPAQATAQKGRDMAPQRCFAVKDFKEVIT
eukprot:NODE_1165_length_1443_cov_1.016717_g1154_i0.p2 GENE.NODE_1165_length_1443_cov_1.016717_g1154_i0~~NODE_1165_length_1443_cov_1.016717_g1154_i0.p2  ORF type:complete len:154 (+),score=28.97 NODE_1165_length_1443_cov_1.016717_g1154_i0:546-1007(+)